MIHEISLWVWVNAFYYMGLVLLFFQWNKEYKPDLESRPLVPEWPAAVSHNWSTYHISGPASFRHSSAGTKPQRKFKNEVHVRNSPTTDPNGKIFIRFQGYIHKMKRKRVHHTGRTACRFVCKLVYETVCKYNILKGSCTMISWHHFNWASVWKCMENIYLAILTYFCVNIFTDLKAFITTLLIIAHTVCHRSE